ncbi:hypothetical protein TorRG33x02_132970 [Trema orientale]|uniref:DUF4283 domain-containing protein n=1 Tax=Trema orientale TaxID=63057 RepID=A0A2P5EZC4_TREOI|nr:hypothetical protein TorRG33x02_132970 [Trema orientale]
MNDILEDINALVAQTSNLHCYEKAIELEECAEADVGANKVLWVGKLISLKPHSRSFVRSVLSQIWGLQRRLKVTKLERNKFTFLFPSAQVKYRIVEWGPWTISREHLRFNLVETLFGLRLRFQLQNLCPQAQTWFSQSVPTSFRRGSEALVPVTNISLFSYASETWDEGSGVVRSDEAVEGLEVNIKETRVESQVTSMVVFDRSKMKGSEFPDLQNIVITQKEYCSVIIEEMRKKGEVDQFQAHQALLNLFYRGVVGPKES